MNIHRSSLVQPRRAGTPFTALRTLRGSTALPPLTQPCASFRSCQEGLRWARPAIDVQLEDRVEEIDAPALLEVYCYSQTPTANALSKTGMITTRRGLMIRTVATGTPTHQVLVPGTVVSHSGLHGFDAAFEMLSRSNTSCGVAS